jgi:hypothetical protein
VGQSISDATISLAAVDPCYCCTERLAVAIDQKSGRRMMNAKEIIALSRKQTERLKNSKLSDCKTMNKPIQ